VKVQEDFKDLGRGILDELDVYIAHCDAVVHLVGGMTGAAPGERDVSALVAKYSDLTGNLPPLGEALEKGRAFPGCNPGGVTNCQVPPGWTLLSMPGLAALVLIGTGLWMFGKEKTASHA
jgi:hypothetical protein